MTCTRVYLVNFAILDIKKCVGVWYSFCFLYLLPVLASAVQQVVLFVAFVDCFGERGSGNYVKIKELISVKISQWNK